MAESLKCVIVPPAAPLPKGFQDFWAEAASVASPKLLGKGGALSLSWLSQWFNFSTRPRGCSPLCLSPALGKDLKRGRVLANSCRSSLPLAQAMPCCCRSEPSGFGSPRKDFVKCNFPEERCLDFLHVFLSLKGTGIQTDGC